jgi:VCBS repeat-containing protein
MDQDATLTVSAADGVLANDSDPDQDPLTASLQVQPSSGAVTLNSDGSFDYTPQAGFVGDDSFTYVASDGLQTSNPATVTITVNPTATPPATP